jgi:hypothetical protein
MDIVQLVVSIFLLGIIGVMIWAFLFVERHSEDHFELGALSGRTRVECEFCGNVYEDVPEENLSRCPVCGSYNKLPAGESAGEDKGIFSESPEEKST